MSDENIRGTPWSDAELDAIVHDYFEMLALELAGRSFVKARHNAALMEQTGRSHRSIEFKHQNISAVLDELGMPWIRGYIPKLNYQNAIFDAIERYVTNHQAQIELQPQTMIEPLPLEIVFVGPPLRETERPLPERLRKLIRKFDPAERDRRNRALGLAGEEFVLDVERRRLFAANRPDLASKIRWVAQEEGDGAGYDILSFGTSGEPYLLEIKTTNGSARTPFFLSRNECDLASERPQDWFIYRVHTFSTQPRIFTITPPLDNALHLRPESWRASF